MYLGVPFGGGQPYPNQYPNQYPAYPNSPGGYPQQGFGRFRRAAKDALVFPNEENDVDKKAALPQPEVVKVDKPKSDDTKPDLDSRFGLLGGVVRGVIGGLVRGEQDRQYGAYGNGPYERPPYERPPYGRPPYGRPPSYNPYPEHHNHHHGRPDYYQPGIKWSFKKKHSSHSKLTNKQTCLAL